MCTACSSPPPPNPIDGKAAYKHVKAMVDLGPRPAGTIALKRCAEYIRDELKKSGLEAKFDLFKDNDFAPGIQFRNVVLEIPGSDPNEKRVMVLGSHYDTKRVHGKAPDPNMIFVGANDAGSSSGLLIELAKHFAKNPLPCALICIWFDGEESLPWEWNDDKALFGSRHHAAQLRSRFPEKDRLDAWVPAMVLLDMVGHKKLQITEDEESDPAMIKIIAETAKWIGHGDKFFEKGNKMPVVDDHKPYKDYGIRVIDLIQFGRTAGRPDNISPWWHTADDNMSIISAESLAIVGHVVSIALPKFYDKFYKGK